MLTSREIQEIASRTASLIEKEFDEVLTLSGAAALLGKTEAAVKQMCLRNQLPYSKHLKSYYFSKIALTKFLLSGDRTN